MKNRVVLASLLAALSLLLVNCKSDSTSNTNSGSGSTGDTKPAYSPTGDEATVTGKINFTGEAPAPKKIDMASDSFCATAPVNNTEDVVVANGKLANVFVYVKGGPVDKFSFGAPSGAVTLDQKGCRYHPHVMGVQVNQDFKVTNSDGATHNIHPSPKSNQEWNQSQAPGAAPIEKKFSRPETLIPVKCNQHPWMKCYVGVLSHSFFSVSDEKDGSYTIKGLPPGEYTLVAWHEKYGEQTQKITVAAKETKTQDFSFSAASANAGTSLKVETALVLP